MLSVVTNACERLASQFDDFWLFAALGDWSYEEGERNSHYRRYLESWLPTELPPDLLPTLRMGINGNLAELIRADPAVREVTTSPSRGPDIVFQAEAGKSTVQVKLLFDCTISKYLVDVEADRSKDCSYQVVFFVSLPNFQYPAGRWCGKDKLSPARQVTTSGVEAQYSLVRERLGAATWPTDGPLVNELPVFSTAVDAAIQAWLARVFKPKAGPWSFDATAQLHGARIAVAVWDWRT